MPLIYHLIGVLVGIAAYVLIHWYRQRSFPLPDELSIALALNLIAQVLIWWIY